MPSFTADFFIDDVKFQFQFNKISTPNGRKYFVNAINEQNRKYSFVMEQNDREWRIVNAPKLPERILNIENELSTIIKDNNYK
ncbi:MAG: hypothetical protein ACJ75B_08320 [Flavisolibacter sp.]